MTTSAKNNVLLVEDDISIATMLQDTLSNHGFSIHWVPDTAQAKEEMLHQRFNLILLDWMLPGVTGLSFARQLRQSQNYHSIPFIILTAKAQEQDRLSGFDAGADDYVIKPFSIKELAARMRVVLKRSYPSENQKVVECHNIRLDPQSYRLMINNQLIRIGRAEFNLLHFFMMHPEKVFTRDQLLRHSRHNVYVELRTIDVHIRRLRKLLEPSGKGVLLQTVHGVGYRFSTQL